MKETISNLQKQKDTYQTCVQAIERAITALQAVCIHEWKPNGNDSHYDYEKCDICQKTRSI